MLNLKQDDKKITKPTPNRIYITLQFVYNVRKYIFEVIVVASCAVPVNTSMHG